MTLARLRNIRPRRAVPRRSTWETRTDPTWIESLLTESVRLNQTGRSFTRATSAWDPVHNCILPPGVARQCYVRYRDRVSIPLDLIEGAATNLLAAGSSEHFELTPWSLTNATITTGITAPDGSATACFLNETSATGNHFVGQNVTSANGTYTASVFVKANGTTSCVLDMSDLSTGDAEYTLNLNTGALTAGPGGVGSWTAISSTAKYAGNGWWFVTVTGTRGAGTQTSFRVFGYNGGISYTGTVGHGINVWGATLTQTAFPSSYISNRNFLTKSNTLTAGGPWGAGGSGGTIAHNGGTMPNGETAWTVTCAGVNDNWQYDITGLTAGTTYTVSWLAKAGTATYVAYRFFDSTHGSFIAAGVNYISQITSSGFTRIIAQVTTPAGCTAVAILFTYANGQAGGIGTTIIGDCQFEIGSSATAYWGTNATVGGRDADSLISSYNTGTGNGTMLALAIPYGWSTTQGAGSNYHLFDDNNTESTTKIVVLGASGGASVNRTDSSSNKSAAGPLTPTPVNGSIIQYGFTWDATKLLCYDNGVSGSPSATTAPPYVATTSFIIGARTGLTVQFSGWVAVLAEPRAWTALENMMVGQYANLAIGQA